MDENGTVRDKSTKISAMDGGLYAYGMTDNNTQVYFPSSSKNGTKITLNDYAVTMTPIASASAAPVYVDEDSVRYDGVFGSNTSVLYQTKLNGIKEDIVLIRNIGKNEFQFELTLQNLIPFEQDGIWYLRNAENETVATFGEIVIRDTASNTALGTMQITAGTARGQYTVTVTAPEAFLNASTTVYPVYVDPSITYYIWEESEYDDGFGEYTYYDSITDTGLYSTEAAAQYAVTNPEYHRLGYISDASGTATGKIIYKLHDFFGPYGQYKDLRASQIGRVSLFIDTEAGDETTVTVNPMTDTWLADVVGENPTALYNSTLWSAYDSTYGSTSTLDEASGFQTVDITSIVKGWARFNTGEAGAAYNPANGFVLSNNATDTFREMYSSEASVYNDVYVLMDTGLIGDIYYVNNANTAKYLKANGLNPTTALYEATSNIKWHIEYIGDGKYYVRSATDQTQVLCDVGGTLYMLGLPEDEQSNAYKWEAITGDGIILKNVHTGNVIRHNGTSLVMSAQLSSTDANYKQTVWYIIDERRFVPMTDFELNDDWLLPNTTKTFKVESDASWSSNDCFTWSIRSGSSQNVFTVTNDGRITAGQNGGIATLTVTHKMSGMEKTFAIRSGELRNGLYMIKNKGTSRYMDVEGPSMASGAYIQQWDYHTGNQAKWYLVLDWEGYYTIYSYYSFRYLQAGNSSNANAIIQNSTATSDGAKWYITKTSEGNYKLSPINATNYAVSVPLNADANGTNLVRLAYTDDGNYRDEWVFNYILPLSGSEIAYEPDSWNAEAVRPYTNCYNYALNKKNEIPEGIYYRMQPGETGGNSVYYRVQKGTSGGYPYYYNQIKTPNQIETYAIADAAYYGITLTPISKYDVCPAGTYKIALVVDYTDDANVVNDLRLWQSTITGEIFWLDRPDTDYHWYRQNADGTWSHKPGITEVINVDASNNIIFDPEICNRNDGYFDYSVFVGYYAVSPLG